MTSPLSSHSPPLRLGAAAFTELTKIHAQFVSILDVVKPRTLLAYPTVAPSRCCTLSSPYLKNHLRASNDVSSFALPPPAITRARKGRKEGNGILVEPHVVDA